MSQLSLNSLKKQFRFNRTTTAKRPDDGPARLRYFAANARVLADFMESHDIRHEQNHWGSGNPAYPCKTAACALGSAAVFDLIPGLQYTYSRTSFEEFLNTPTDLRAKLEFGIQPVINGEHFDDWDEAGYYFFGEDIHDNVFANGGLSKAKVVAGLRAYALRHEADATLEEMDLGADA